MIQLVHIRRASNMPAPRGRILRVAYRSITEIPSLLLPRPQSVPENPPSLVAPANNASSYLSDTISRPETPSVHGDTTNSDLGTAPPPANALEDPQSLLLEGVAETLSEEDLARLRKLASIWANTLQSRAREAAYPTSKLWALRTRFFKLLLDKAESTVAADSKYYRKLYLGCVPHALVCLDIVLEYVRAEKRATTKRLLDKKLNHLELDAVQSEIKTFSCVKLLR